MTDELPPGFVVDDKAEYEERRQELIEDAAESRREVDEKQQEALREIAAGESLERYETIQLGNLEMEVKAWMPGDTLDAVEQAQAAAQSEDLAQVKRSIDTMLSALDEMTRSATYDMAFWRQYYAEYGPNGLLLAMQAVLKPATDQMEAKGEAVDGFRTNVERAGDSPGE